MTTVMATAPVVMSGHRRLDLDAVFIAAAAAVLVALIGAIPGVVVGTDTGWFDPPWWYPPEVVFPIVWTGLFVLKGIAVSIVWRADRTRRSVRRALGWFALQFALNLAWTPAFFGLRAPWLALGVLLALWLAIVATIAAFGRVDRHAAVLLLPYLGWVTFAGGLNAAIAVGG